jgi:hypothetical protein
VQALTGKGWISILRHLQARVKRWENTRTILAPVSVRSLIASWRTGVRSAWRRSKTGTIVVALVGILSLGLGLALGLELLLRGRSAYLQSQDNGRHAQLAQAYAPFMSESLHPNYLFFFPPPGERAALGNAVCSLDEGGFREPGPARAQGRKLAFVIGGSVAFSLFASSNATTITSFMNRMQDEYFFVTAGVPGFNSSQELVRLSLELLDHAPAMVIAFDGFNDINLAREPKWLERGFPPGTPEGFPVLQDMVAAAQAPWRHLVPDGLFYELSLRLDRGGDGGNGDEDRPMSEGAVAAAAARYSLNQARMASLAQAAGTRFVSVFQPMASLHRYVSGPFAGPDDVAERFHQLAMTGRPAALETYDMARVFDEYFAAVPMAEPDITDTTIFIDAAHFYDPGNEIVARHLLRLIGQPSHEP